MILVVTDAFDVHADLVIAKAEALSAPVFRLDLDVASLQGTRAAYRDGSWTLGRGPRSLASADVRAVWCRRTAVSVTSEHEGDASNGFRLWRSEWNRTLYGLFSALGGAFWLNHVRAATLADNKFHQLRVAAECGLRVPRFVTSNDRAELVAFAGLVGDVALKFMAQDIYRSDEGGALGLYVNRLTERELSDFGGLAENPVTLQEYVEKAYEVRYTFVEGKHMACKILSQSNERTKIDWRRYDVPNTPHLAMDPDPGIASQVDDLMARLGLAFGALDFIVDQAGQWWFLEVNSAGQWLWIEDLAGLPISDSIATCLVNHAGALSQGKLS